MSDCSRAWWVSSRLLSDTEFEQMLKNAEVLEQDERGYKVVKLETGDILKIFRIRHKKSFARLYSNARRFMSNANKLRQLGINTVEVKQLYHFEKNDNTAVLYSPLAGVTLKKLLERQQVSQEMSQALGLFVAQLHKLGVHFRSLHMGNIVFTPNNEYGLIDVSDMKTYGWSLFCNTRARNFRHITRYPEDIQRLGSAGWESFVEGYFFGSQLGRRCEARIRDVIAMIEQRWKFYEKRPE